MDTHCLSCPTIMNVLHLKGMIEYFKLIIIKYSEISRYL